MSLETRISRLMKNTRFKKFRWTIPLRAWLQGYTCTGVAEVKRTCEGFLRPFLARDGILVKRGGGKM
jgi:hypothetical protein